MNRVTRNWSGVQLTWSRDRGWTASRTYKVTGPTRETDLYGVTDAVTGLRLPLPNESHDQNALLRVDGWTPRETDPGVWEVAITYSIPGATVGGGTNASDALKEPATFSWEEQVSSEPTDTDAWGNPIVNAAGDAFDPPQQQQVTRRVLVVTRNEPFFDKEKAGQYVDRVAQSDFSLASVPSVGTLKGGETMLMSYIAVGEYAAKPAPKFMRCRYRFLIDPWGFRRKLLNQGKAGWYLDPTSNSPRKHFFYVNSAAPNQWDQVSSDVLLDRDGLPINKEADYRVTNQGKAPIKNPKPLKYVNGDFDNGVILSKSSDGRATFLKYLVDFYADLSQLSL